MAQERSSPTPATPTQPQPHWVRIVLAGALVVLGAVAFLSFRVCEEHVTDSGEVVEVCRRLEVTDVVVVSGLLILVFLIWPWVSEAGIPGFLTLKRRVRETEQQLATLQVQLASIASASSSANVSNMIAFPITPDTFKGFQVELPAKRERFLSRLTAPAEPAASATPPSEEPEVATLAIELLTLWEELDRELSLTARMQANLASLPPETAERRARFLALFEEELGTVRATRNTVAHGPARLSRAELQGAVETARDLLRIWRTSES